MSHGSAVRALAVEDLTLSLSKGGVFARIGRAARW
jgi:hypothetical protein